MPERMALVAGRTLYGLPGPHEEVRAALHNPNAGRLARRPRGRWRRRGRRRDGLTVRACAAVGGPNDQKGETRPERSSHRRDLTMRLAGRQAVLGKRETAWGRRLRCAFPQGDTPQGRAPSRRDVRPAAGTGGGNRAAVTRFGSLPRPSFPDRAMVSIAPMGCRARGRCAYRDQSLIPNLRSCHRWYWRSFFHLIVSFTSSLRIS